MEKGLWCCAVAVVIAGAAFASAPVYVSGLAAGLGVLAIAFLGNDTAS